MSWQLARYKHTAAQEKRRASELISTLQQCHKRKDLETGKKIHQTIEEHGLHQNIVVANTLLNMYRKCGNMELARDVFESMRRKDVASWNSLILGYVESGESFRALEVFNNMDYKPSHVTYIAALKACAVLASKTKSDSERQTVLRRGKDIHENVKERGLEKDISVASTLIDMYSKCGEIDPAGCIFEKMPVKDVVAWNCVILGYVENGQSHCALQKFMSMDCEPDRVTYIAMIKACTNLASREGAQKREILEKGMNIHEQVKKLGSGDDMITASALMDMYSKCGEVRLAKNIFERLTRKDVVAWTCLILGYVENGENNMALELFENMDCEPNNVTYVAVLKACACLAALPYGRVTHSRICKAGLEGDYGISNTLVDFYGRCASMETATEVFNGMHSPDQVSWNALITGYSSVGDFHRVLTLVEVIQQAGVELDAITFVSVLTACSHAGMVEEGKMYFQSMQKHSVRPGLEHYTCMVDMLGRANRVDEALSLIKEMPFKADVVIWKTLLGACRKWKNVEVADVAFQAILAGDQSRAAGAYVLMHDIYGNS